MFLNCIHVKTHTLYHSKRKKKDYCFSLPFRLLLHFGLYVISKFLKICLYSFSPLFKFILLTQCHFSWAFSSIFSHETYHHEVISDLHIPKPLINYMPSSSLWAAFDIKNKFLLLENVYSLAFLYTIFSALPLTSPLPTSA